MFDRAKGDIKAIMDRDPAATSAWETFLCAPGLHAIWGHRLAHWLSVITVSYWLAGFPI